MKTIIIIKWLNVWSQNNEGQRTTDRNLSHARLFSSNCGGHFRFSSPHILSFLFLFCPPFLTNFSNF